MPPLTMTQTVASRPANADAILERLAQYENSFPGCQSSRELDYLIQYRKEGIATEHQWARLFNTLLYREQAGHLAEKILEIMDLRPFPRFTEWGYREQFVPKYGRTTDSGEYLPFVRARLLPKPLEREGRDWQKPLEYLVAACRVKGLKVAEVQRKVEEVREIIAAKEAKGKDEIPEFFRGENRRSMGDGITRIKPQKFRRRDGQGWMIVY
jgi:hypothetical protein